MTFVKNCVPVLEGVVVLVTADEYYFTVSVLNLCILFVSSGNLTLSGLVGVDTVSVCSTLEDTDTLLAVPRAVANLESVACVHLNGYFINVRACNVLLNELKCVGSCVAPSTSLHIACAGTDEVILIGILNVFIGLVLCEDINVLVDGGIKIKSNGAGCLCIPTIEGLAFDFSRLPSFNLGTLFNFFFLKKLATLVPGNGNLVSITVIGGIVIVTAEKSVNKLTACEACNGESEH